MKILQQRRICANASWKTRIKQRLERLLAIEQRALTEAPDGSLYKIYDAWLQRMPETERMTLSPRQWSPSITVQPLRGSHFKC